MNLHAKIVLGVCLAAAALHAQAPPMAPEVRVTVPSTAKTITSAAYRGDVVVVQFLLTHCTHCQHAAAMLSGLQKEFEGRGLRVIGAAFDDAARGGDAIEGFTKANHVNFPVGYLERNEVLRLLNIGVVERFVVPQIMIIGRDGRLRAKSEKMGSPELTDEQSLRKLVRGLLDEPRAVSRVTR